MGEGALLKAVKKFGMIMYVQVLVFSLHQTDKYRYQVGLNVLGFSCGDNEMVDYVFYINYVFFLLEEYFSLILPL